jgi:hypothetical protein
LPRLSVRFWGLPASQASSQSTASSQLPQLEEATAAREQKAREVTPHQRSTIERALLKLEDDLVLERVLDPPRGIYVRVGSMGEGSGFALGPALRYNTPRFDFKASAAASTKTYFSGDVALRFPGTVGQDEYFKSEGAVRRTARSASGVSARGLLRSGTRQPAIESFGLCPPRHPCRRHRRLRARPTSGGHRPRISRRLHRQRHRRPNAVVHRDFHDRRDAWRERPRGISGDRAVLSSTRRSIPRSAITPAVAIVCR